MELIKATMREQKIKECDFEVTRALPTHGFPDAETFEKWMVGTIWIAHDDPGYIICGKSTYLYVRPGKAITRYDDLIRSWYRHYLPIRFGNGGRTPVFPWLGIMEDGDPLNIQRATILGRFGAED